ncbi:hypothetical protein BSIN_0067 [Burkholderia singularis]|uniref:Uncharacterized protein n=1 Tax=Burkholderia singularis TaxID=1503053 RepID=A0A238H269_9BURK|nr:hypothetical protein BSIN_0067 [Burkholderia singularis]
MPYVGVPYGCMKTDAISAYGNVVNVTLRDAALKCFRHP